MFSIDRLYIEDKVREGNINTAYDFISGCYVKNSCNGVSGNGIDYNNCLLMCCLKTIRYFIFSEIELLSVEEKLTYSFSI